MAEGLHALIIVGMHPKPLGSPVCFVGNNQNTRVNVDAELPSELATRGVSEDDWKKALAEMDELNRNVMGGCCLECACAAISFTLVLCLPCWCIRNQKQQQKMQDGVYDINNKHFVHRGVSLQWSPSNKHGPGGLQFYETVDDNKTVGTANM
ncbi:MAG: hypothetical protein SGILL_004190 [Bacillariaceae sp.]